MDRENYRQLMDKGDALMEEKDFPGAEEFFRQVLDSADAADSIPALNNLALAINAGGSPERALKTLKPYLESDPPQGNPYTFSFAAQLLANLEQPEEARQYLDRAVKLFESALPHLADMNIFRPGWYEYTVQIMRAASTLGDHRLVLDLYRRLEKYHVNWENRYMAGVAHFNLGRYKQAASTWEALNKISNFTVPLQQVALIMEQGTIPPFELDYSPPSWKEVEEIFKEAGGDRTLQEEAIAIGHIRIILLDIVFSELSTDEQKKEVVELLINFGGEWGKEFGLRILESAGLPRELKHSAAFALVERGVFKEGENIPVLLDGGEDVIRITTSEVSFEKDPEMDRLTDEAIALREEGNIDQAIALLEEPYREGKFYPRAMITLGNLYRTRENWVEARNIFGNLSSILPDDPVVQLNLAGLCLETGDYEQAIECIDRLDEVELSDKFREQAEYARRSALEMLEGENPPD